MAKLEQISSRELINLIANRTQQPVSHVREFVKAAQIEVAECVNEGYEVNLFGIAKLSFKHSAAKPRRKGVSPFDPGAGEVWFKAKPEALKAKVRALSIVTKAIPRPSSTAGKAIVASLTSKRGTKQRARPAAKRAPAKRSTVKRRTARRATTRSRRRRVSRV